MFSNASETSFIEFSHSKFAMAQRDVELGHRVSSKQSFDIILNDEGY